MIKVRYEVEANGYVTRDGEVVKFTDNNYVSDLAKVNAKIEEYGEAHADRADIAMADVTVNAVYDNGLWMTEPPGTKTNLRTGNAILQTVSFDYMDKVKSMLKSVNQDFVFTD